jgi:predicted ATP-grasp superfamily ATP-dependent carboligase
MEEELKGMRNNKVNIDFLKEQVKKLNEDVEKLIRNGNGAH